MLSAEKLHWQLPISNLWSLGISLYFSLLKLASGNLALEIF